MFDMALPFDVSDVLEHLQQGGQSDVNGGGHMEVAQVGVGAKMVTNWPCPQRAVTRMCGQFRTAQGGSARSLFPFPTRQSRTSVRRRENEQYLDVG